MQYHLYRSPSTFLSLFFCNIYFHFLTTREEEWIKKIQEEDASHQDQHMALVHACGVTIEWLLAFTFDHNCWHRPTWWVNRHIIKEATRQNRRRYMDLDEMKQYKRPATIFISHCWGAVWGDVVLAACHGARFGRVVWIDLFAVRQWPGNGADLDFRNVINKCQAFIVLWTPTLTTVTQRQPVLSSI